LVGFTALLGSFFEDVLGNQPFSEALNVARNVLTAVNKIKNPEKSRNKDETVTIP